MSIRFVCRQQNQLAITVWDGVVSRTHWPEFFNLLIRDAAFLSVRNHILDVRFASFDNSLTAKEVETLASILTPALRSRVGYQLAIAAGKEFALSGLFARLMNPHVASAIVFNHLDTACAWLGLDYYDIEHEIHRIRSSMHLHNAVVTAM